MAARAIAQRVDFMTDKRHTEKHAAAQIAGRRN
jgi:hypothetical protein